LKNIILQEENKKALPVQLAKQRTRGYKTAVY